MQESTIYPPAPGNAIPGSIAEPPEQKFFRYVRGQFTPGERAEIARHEAGRTFLRNSAAAADRAMEEGLLDPQAALMGLVAAWVRWDRERGKRRRVYVPTAAELLSEMLREHDERERERKHARKRRPGRLTMRVLEQDGSPLFAVFDEEEGARARGVWAEPASAPA